MRRFKRTVKAIVIVLACAACAAFALLIAASPVFSGGEGYELYYGASSSSLTKQTDSPLRDKLLSGGAAGESVRYAGDCAEELAASFRAELLFTERAGDVVNYYYYSPLLKGGVNLFGYTVNLHIAVREAQTAAGTPLIFGGF